MISGRAFGIPVRISPGWLSSYLLIAASLVLWFGLPGAVDTAPAVRFLAVLAVPVLLLPAVVAHELGHALTARRRGVAVSEIDLRLIGVAAPGDHGDRDPATEALVALAGPAVSAVIGVVTLVIAIVAERTDTETAALVSWVATCLATGNLLLAAVSLYPGAPMDGGQVVHAVARRISVDPATATRRTATVAIAAGWSVMGAGLLVAITVDPTAGLWLTLMGWFLGRASRLARSQDRLMRLTEGLDVGDALQRDMPVVSPYLTLDTLVDQDQLSGGPGVYPVRQGTTLLGIIDVQDIRAVPAKQRTQLRVQDRLRPLSSVRSVREDQELWDAVTILEQGRLRALLVVDPHDPAILLGLVTRASVMHLLRARGGRPRTDTPR